MPCRNQEVKMVRGCQKKIIYLKNSGSDLFEEAYFIIKNSPRYEEFSECDMIEEANRIIEESFCIDENESLGRRLITFLKRSALPFALGLALGVLFALIF